MFVNLCSLVVIAIIAHTKPYHSKGDRRMEIWNEFIILIIYGQVLCQTEFIEDPIRRMDTGWFLIGVITLAVVTNFGYVLYTEGAVVVNYLRLTNKKA